MKFLLCLAALMAGACAQVSVSPEELQLLPHPYLYKAVIRHPRDLTWDKQIGDSGKVFGTLGQNDNGLFGKGGYNHEIFNDDRGKLNAEAYGSRHLGPDSTSFGTGLKWSNDNARAGLDLNRPIGGHTGLKATGEGLWHLGKNTDISAGGFYTQPFLGHGRSDYGFQGGITHRF